MVEKRNVAWDVTRTSSGGGGITAQVSSSPQLDALLESTSIELVPGAACIVECDRYFTILWANEAFYRLMGRSEQEMGFRYARHLSALWDKDASDELARIARGEDAGDEGLFHHRVTTPEGQRELETSALRMPWEDSGVICCFSRDRTHEIELEAQIAQLRGLGGCVSATVGLEAFSYDETSRTARIVIASDVLGHLGAEGVICENFPEALVDAGLVHPDDRDAFLRVFTEAAACPLASDSQEKDIRAACDVRLGGAMPNTGRWRWFRLMLVSCRNDFLPSGSSGGGVIIDITEQKELAMAYLNETQFYFALLAERQAYAHVDVTDDAIVKAGGLWNLYNEIIATVSYSDIVSEFINKVVHLDDRAHYAEIMRCENFLASFENGIDILECEFRRIVEQNKMMWMKLDVHLLKDPTTGHVMALLTITNIDKKKRQELMLQSSSARDSLTGVLHRKAAEAAVRARLRIAAPHDIGALAILDIDDFKGVNDLCGRAAGDATLMRFAEIVRCAAGKDDVIGRFGGDEFILFVSKAFDRTHMANLFDDLLARLAREAEPPIVCSVGVALVEGESSFEEAFHRADIALYAAKREGGATYQFYRDTEQDPYVADLQEGYRERPVDALPSSTGGLPAALQVSGAKPFAEARKRVAGVAESAGEHSTFADFMSAQGEIAYLVDPDTFSLICGNEAFYERIGETPSSCLGMKCYEAMQRRTTPCPFCSKANWSTDKFFMWKNNNEALDQEFLIKNKLVIWQGREVLLAEAVDISNNKSVVDSLDNGMAEGSFLLAGIQQMNAARGITDVVDCALSTAAGFFRADIVRFWTRENLGERYRCTVTWSRNPGVARPVLPEGGALDSWLEGNDWDEPVMVESPEAVLRESFALYRYMKDNGVANMRWTMLRDGAPGSGPVDFLSVENLHMNLQNVAFLEQFATFMASELRKRRMVNDLLHAGSHDNLTGLLNRSSYERRMAAFDADRVDSVGVVSANVNGMKQINSEKGFDAGNYYLRHFASLLTDAFPTDGVFRLNGDEFAVLAFGIPREELEGRIRALRDAVEQDGQFNAAIGYSWDKVEKNLSELTEQAVAAMEADKKRFHDRSHDRLDDNDRRAALRRVVSAIDADAFAVYLQPKVDMATGALAGAEALVRYRNAKGEIVPPARFIPGLEENGLIRHVDLFVFEQVCRLLEKWCSRNVQVPVSLNLSRRTVLESDILPSMENIAARYDFNRNDLEVEITESFALVGKGVLYQTATDLLTAGFSLSLDDFGTKYTDLSILANIDFSMIKLDKSLIDALGDDATKQVVVKHIISMCSELRIDVIAEGVETGEQERLLRKLGCHLGQGYLYGRPVSIEDFERAFLPAG